MLTTVEDPGGPKRQPVAPSTDTLTQWPDRQCHPADSKITIDTLHKLRIASIFNSRWWDWSRVVWTFIQSRAHMVVTRGYAARVEQFCADLKVLNTKEVTRKHITTGLPALLNEDQYFTLRSVIADEFDVYPSEVVLVGSCRMGFSIAPRTAYREAHSASDLDIAIVSQERFDDFWDGVFTYATSNIEWKGSNEHKEFVRMLFNGWIDPRGLPNVDRFKQATRWTSFFDGLMQSRQFGSRRISARLYRTWMRLEAYQEQSVRKCVVNLGDQHA